MDFEGCRGFKILQRVELSELFGYESRNKYEIQTLEGNTFGFATEECGGWFSLILRQYTGRLRSFKIHFYGAEGKEPFFSAHHPLRFYFQRLDVKDSSGRPIGALQKRFGILNSKFDCLDERGRVFLRVSLPFWRFWTFKFLTVSGKSGGNR